VTAIAFGPKLKVKNGFILAAGSEGGDLNYWVVGAENSSILTNTPTGIFSKYFFFVFLHYFVIYFWLCINAFLFFWLVRMKYRFCETSHEI
jgi:hypothetical protein